VDAVLRIKIIIVLALFLALFWLQLLALVAIRIGRSLALTAQDSIFVHGERLEAFGERQGVGHESMR
jgi:hypothetical protein